MSQQSIQSPGGPSELHADGNGKLPDFFLCVLPLDTRDKQLSPSNAARKEKHSSATVSFMNYAKTVGGGKKMERNGCWVKPGVGNQMTQAKKELYHTLKDSLGLVKSPKASV